MLQKNAKVQAMPKFVILEHTTKGQSPSDDSQVHWDLMFEVAAGLPRELGRLSTWQVPCPPGDWFDGPVACRKIFDHRPQYLTYEGPISQNRGQVRRLDGGSYAVLEISGQSWKVSIEGRFLKGIIYLQAQGREQWELHLEAVAAGR